MTKKSVNMKWLIPPIMFFCLLVIFACSTPSTKEVPTQAEKMKYSETDFGIFEGHKVSLFTLENANGMSVKIMDYGATVTSIKMPNENGIIEEITCGFDTFESYFSAAYQSNSPYFGGTVGRYASQIKNATFTLNGATYQLAKNAGDNNLHGGVLGFDKKMWEGQLVAKNGTTKLVMELLSKDMEEGFPGNVAVSVTFSLNNDNEFQIDYKATSDKDTPFSITNHIYFNLSGFTTSIENHFVRILSDKRQKWDASGVATGVNLSLDNAPDDLRKSKSIKSVQEEMGDGFEHYYLFDKKGFKLEKVAAISCPEGGRSLEVKTTEPGMLFYTGKYTSNDLKRESGLAYGKYRGLCFETSRYPNGPNIDAPKSILKAGEVFESSTIFQFKW